MCPCSIHSCCYIWLYKGQRRWAVIYGGCNHLCDKEEWWRLVWRSLQSSNWLVSWELRWINHALCRLKSFAFPSWVLYSVIPWLFTRVTKANRIVLIYFQIKMCPFLQAILFILMVWLNVHLSESLETVCLTWWQFVKQATVYNWLYLFTYALLILWPA